MEEFLDLAEEDIFISKGLMELLREKIGYKKGFSITIHKATSDWKNCRYRTKVVLIIQEKDPISSLIITKGPKHINPLKFIDRETWTQVWDDIHWILEGEPYKDMEHKTPSEFTFWPEKIEGGKVILTSGGWFNGLYKSSLSKIETRIKQLREYLPFEIWKQPQDIPKQSQALQDRLKWWREYIESLDRSLNSVELYYMPIRLIPNAM